MSGERPSRARWITAGVFVVVIAWAIAPRGDDDANEASTGEGAASTTIETPAHAGDEGFAADASLGSVTTSSTVANAIAPAAPDVALAPGSPGSDARQALSLRIAGRARVDELTHIYRERDAFPEWSSPITAAADPVAAHAAPLVVAIPQTGGASLEATVSTGWVAAPGQKLPLHLALHDEDGNSIALRDAELAVMDTFRTGFVAHVPLTRIGADGSLSGEWNVPDEATIALDPGIHAFFVHGYRQDDGTEVALSSALLLTAPQVHETGRFTDRREGGDLVVSIEVRVDSPCRVHVAATLGPATGTRVYAEKATMLEKGVFWVDVRFFGRALRSLGADGPWPLQAVDVADTSQFPAARRPTLARPYVTAAYRRDAFSDAKWTSGTLGAVADRIERRFGVAPGSTP